MRRWREGGVCFVSFFFFCLYLGLEIFPRLFFAALCKNFNKSVTKYVCVCVCVCSFSLERGIVDHLTFKIGEVCGEECVRSWKLERERRTSFRFTNLLDLDLLYNLYNLSIALWGEVDKKFSNKF